MTHKEIIPMHKDTYFFGYGIDIEDPIELAHKIIEQDKEIKKLNNIINELENYIVENSFGNPANNCCVIETYKILDKLQELKEANMIKKIV